ncbi:MAG: hypothetical protein IPG71_10300 [bacterium]|nr:hypothetical protein [bacterium]
MARLSTLACSLLLTVLTSYGFEISGTLSGGTGGFSLKYVYIVPTSLDTVYITIANILNNTYSQDELDEGGYMLFAFQDVDFSFTPGIDEPRGFYGGDIPQVLDVSSDTSDIDIELSDPNAGGFSGEIVYEGTETGATYVIASRVPDFSGFPSGGGLLFSQDGNGEYTALVDSFGTYYAYAYMDVNTNFVYDIGEPYDMYGTPEDPEPIVIEQGEQYPDDVDFELVPVPDAASPTPVVREFKVGSPYPNPFNPTTSIPFSLDRTMEMEIVARDVLGRTVATLARGMFAAGEHSVTFDGNGLATGIYWIELRAGGMHVNTPAILVK